MKLGVFRRSFTRFHELLRTLSPFADYFIWLVIDPYKFKIIKTDRIKKLLVVLVNEEAGNVGGDFCLLGALNFFKEKYKQVEVSILVDKKTGERFGKVPGIEMIEYKDRKTLDQLKKAGFDAVVFMNLAGLSIKDFIFIPYRVSPFFPSLGAVLRLKGKFYVTRRVFIPWGMHMVEIEFKILKSLGFKFPSMGVKFYHDKNEEKKVDNFLKKNKIKKYVIIHPGGKFVAETYKRGKWPPHLWPLDRYAKVADYFIEKGYSVIITGSPNESLLYEEIKKNSTGKIINGCGLFSIRELGVLLKKSALLIATDTSIVHVAYQVGTKIVELMGPSCPEVVGAWPVKSPRHRILFDNGPCARTMKKVECPEDIVCMNNITIDQVIEAGDELIGRRAKG